MTDWTAGSTDESHEILERFYQYLVCTCTVSVTCAQMYVIYVFNWQIIWWALKLVLKIIVSHACFFFIMELKRMWCPSWQRLASVSCLQTATRKTALTICCVIVSSQIINGTNYTRLVHTTVCCDPCIRWRIANTKTFDRWPSKAKWALRNTNLFQSELLSVPNAYSD